MRAHGLFRRLPWLAGAVPAPVLLATAALLAWSNSFQVPWYLDDFATIVANPSIRKIWPPGPALTPPATSGTGGRPIANLSFALNHAAGGESVRGYHLANLGFHVLSACCLYGLIRRTPGLVRLDKPELRPTPRAIALGAALLWTVHPLQTSAVTYVSQRTELLMGLAYFFTLYGFNRAVREESRFWGGASVAACTLGMACKESMVTAPALVLLYDRAFLAGSFGAALRQRWRYYLALAASWILLGFLLTTGLNERHLGFGLGVSAGTYGLTQSQAILTYLRLSLWPHPLVFDYGPAFVTSASVAAPYLATVSVLAAGATWLAWRHPRLGFGAVAFLVLLAPTSSIVPIALQPMAENRVYLPLAAITVLATCALGLFHRRAFAVLVGAALLSLGVLTWRRNLDYQSTVVLWSDTVAKRPHNPRAHDNLAQALLSSGRTEEGLAAYRRALELNPASGTTQAMLADALFRFGRFHEAENAYRAALHLQPDRDAWRNNLGAVLVARQEHGAAISELTPLVHRSTATAETHQNLGLAHARLGQFPQAVPHFVKALELRPDNAEVHFTYASVLATLRDWPAAATHFRAALRLNPASAAAHSGLAQVLLATNDLSGAVEECQTALRLDPHLADAHNNLGVALVKLDRLEEAAQCFAAAVRLAPNHPDAPRNLANVRAALTRSQP